MARHRAIRNTKSYEYDDFDDYGYGQSYEDDYCVSPGTLAQYSYNRHSDVGLSHFIPSESTVEEENEADIMDGNCLTEPVNHSGVNQNGHVVESALLMDACLEKVKDVVGENYTESGIKTALRKYDFDVERAINHLLSSPAMCKESRLENKFFPKSTADLPVEKPLDQRKPRNRRRDKIQSDNTFQSKPINPSTDVKTVRATNKTPVKTGFNMVASKTQRTFKSNEVAMKQSNISTDLFDSKAENKSSSMNSVSATNSPILSSKLQNKETNTEDYKCSKHAANISNKHKEHTENSKPQISLVVIGHVDAGKSTLMGHILYRCGQVSKKTMHKYEKESKKIGKSSFAFAWVLDETEEERSRGVTMDVALMKFETDHKSILLLDAPGHKDFIPNMISGASQADVALLVINATTGEFEAGFDLGGQTREHSLLVRSLGVAQLAVAVNKLDTVDWSQQRFNEIVKKLQGFLKQAGFKENEVTYVPVSGLSGENLTTKSTTSELSSWYNGPCLLEVIDGFKSPSRPVDYPFRFCVTDVYKGQGSGIQVSGKVETGGISAGDKAIVLPAGEISLIKGIELQDDTKREIAFAGDHVTLTCHGVDMMKIHTGNIISSIQNPIKVVTKFQARLIIFNTDLPITKGFSVELLYKSASEPAVIRKLINILHKSTGDVQTKHPKMVLKGQNATVLIEVFRPICIEEYSEVKELGRFTLRYGGATIAAGIVTKLLTKA